MSATVLVHTVYLVVPPSSPYPLLEGLETIYSHVPEFNYSAGNQELCGIVWPWIWYTLVVKIGAKQLVFGYDSEKTGLLWQ